MKLHDWQKMMGYNTHLVSLLLLHELLIGSCGLDVAPEYGSISSCKVGERIVVTFYEYNACKRWPSTALVESCGMILAKCYGRRLVVLCTQTCSSSTIEEIFIRNTVASVELDTRISINQIDDALLAAAYVNESLVIKQDGPVDMDWGGKQGYSSLNYTHLRNTYGKGNNRTVALLDTGLDAWMTGRLHAYASGLDMISDPELAKDGDGRDYDPLDIAHEGDSDPFMCPMPSWHGTKMAYILAASPTEVDGTLSSGIAPGITLLSMRVLGRCSTGYASDAADSIIWSVGGNITGWESNTDRRADIVLMPFAGKGACPSFLQSAVTMAIEQFNATIIAAAGNNGLPAVENFPGNCRGVISVGAIDEIYEVASYSATGADVYMPGNNIKCSYDQQDACTGTSVSATLAAGVQACGYNLESMNGLDYWVNGTDDDLMITTAANAMDYCGTGTCPNTLFGLYCAGNGYCADCPLDYYCTGTTSTYPCPTNHMSLPAAKWTSASQSPGITYTQAYNYAMGTSGSRVRTYYCILCGAGYYWYYFPGLSVETCMPCDPGYYCTGNNIRTPCPAGQISSSGATQCTATPAPSPAPTPAPTRAPTPAPTRAPTPAPTSAPTPAPTRAPTPTPTTSPTSAPTPSPTAAPTPAPTAAPTPSPTAAPTPAPTSAPTPSPTSAPTPSPTAAPTPAPTAAPTPSPTAAPTPAPTSAPTPSPTSAPMIEDYKYDSDLGEISLRRICSESMTFDIVD
jgi:hypothetical protein